VRKYPRYAYHDFILVIFHNKEVSLYSLYTCLYNPSSTWVY